MSQRILVFESDAAFANELRSSFEALGVTVDVAGDGAQGLDLAAAHRPDLILLTIELPGMNGFLVCKKIKKLDGLADVPLLILSSEATEDVFEQHKKLRTRAEDYIHKPIAFADLLERVKQFVALESNGVGGSEEAIEISDLDDDDVILVADESVPPQAAADDFVQDAVDAMLDGEAPTTPSSRPQARKSSKPAPVSIATHELPVELKAPAGANRGDGEQLLRMRGELEAAQTRISALEGDLEEARRKAAQADQEAQAAKQRISSAERAVAEAGKKGGVSSREFLDLREQLNRKDRELLDLRDQVTSRDKQLIESSDRNLTLERQMADIADRQLELQRELEKNKEIIGALQADKEGSRKRLDDLKSRAERAENRTRELSEELAGIKIAQAKELEAVAEQSKQAQAAALVELEQKHAATLQSARNAHAEELAEVREEHAVALTSAREQGEEQKQDALAKLREELQAEAERRLADQKRGHDTIVSQALGAHERELDATRQSLTQKHGAELRDLTERHQQEVARLSKSLAEFETKSQLLEDQLEEAEASRGDALARLSRTTTDRDQKAAQIEELQARVDRLLVKRSNDAQLLERARKALAIGLSLLDEQNRE